MDTIKARIGVTEDESRFAISHALIYLQIRRERYKFRRSAFWAWRNKKNKNKRKGIEKCTYKASTAHNAIAASLHVRVSSSRSVLRLSSELFIRLNIYFSSFYSFYRIAKQTIGAPCQTRIYAGHFLKLRQANCSFSATRFIIMFVLKIRSDVRCVDRIHKTHRFSSAERFNRSLYHF